MSRGKLRSVPDICADCGAGDSSWASLNRGIVLCDECCSIHRSLGRHISQIKSLKKGAWSPSQLHMLQQLSNGGVNSVWEHTLLDPGRPTGQRKKPQPKDSIHPTKADFIRAKHQMLAFVFRPGKDDTPLQETDLSQQLHSSVRTANLETSLRLLSQGADPNYFHEEKGTTPLHVAAKEGQISQIELLVVYGADPGMTDSQGKTPIDYARLAGHQELADRLVECMYELTDRLAYYLCSRRPDHQNGQHFIIPEMSDSFELTELSKAAKKKLQQLPNHVFEELAMDVYDEVDRRETEAVWMQQTASTLSLDKCPVLFLPVNPEFSTTRNQGRQKLARFTGRDFATLIIDILSDAKRRQCPNVSSSLIISQDTANKLLKGPLTVSAGNSAVRRKSEISDDEPLYDSVASDEDYITAEQLALLTKKSAQTVSVARSQEEKSSEVSKDFSKEKKIERSPNKNSENLSTNTANVESNSTKLHNGKVSGSEDLLRKRLAVSEHQMDELKLQLNILQSKVTRLLTENRDLRRIISTAGLPLQQAAPCESPLHNGHDTEPVLDVRGRSQRPASMYEPREGLRVGGTVGGKKDSSNDYDCPVGPVRPVTQSLYSCSSGGGLPLAEEVVRRTDQVTKRIQELVVSMQDSFGSEAFVPCAERIRVAVAELTAIFPQKPSDENVASALCHLKSNTQSLQHECARLQMCKTETEHSHFLLQVRSCAYDIAKATKQLVTGFDQ